MAVAELQEDSMECHGIHSPAETQVPRGGVGNKNSQLQFPVEAQGNQQHELWSYLVTGTSALCHTTVMTQSKAAASFDRPYMVSFTFLDRKFTQSIVFPQKMFMSFRVFFFFVNCLGVFWWGKEID